MKNKKIKQVIEETVIKLLDNTASDAKIEKIVSKHEAKIHFIPLRYRIFGGLLQSLNIQFGNFIEVLMHKIVEGEGSLEIIKGISGKKKVPLLLTKKTDSLIDHFITDRQNNADKNLEEKFEKLLESIVECQQEEGDTITMKHDIDVLFWSKQDKVLYFVETKYNDDHDTGKFVNINRKFIKTYAGLIKTLKIKDIKSLKPILYYLTKKVMKGNIYVPEGEYIYRGDRFFNQFFTLKYEDLDTYLKDVSEDKEILEIFDKLYNKIRYNK